MKYLSTFKSKKLVKAMKVIEVQACLGGAMLVPEDKELQPVHVNTPYMNKHIPQPGGYFVEYAGGYRSFSPAEAFEQGYDHVCDGDDIPVEDLQDEAELDEAEDLGKEPGSKKEEAKKDGSNTKEE